jgi:hypothetical protein
MRVFSKACCVFSPWLTTCFISLYILNPLASHAQSNWCSCPGGAVLQPGLVNYKENSDREIITKVEVKEADPEHHCEAAWIGFSEVYAEGTPYSFHLERKHLKTIREEECGESLNRFVSRTKIYQFVPNADSQSIREMIPVAETTAERPNPQTGEKTNANIWGSISTEAPPESVRIPKTTPNPSSPEFPRTAWVLARRNIKGRYVSLVRGVDQREKIIALSKTRKIRAGELGQIEASNGHTAIVRFYFGSRIEKFAGKRNAFRRWYDDIGGPYIETKDDLYSALRACILEVSLDDIVEVNDYLDQQKTDQT